MSEISASHSQRRRIAMRPVALFLALTLVAAACGDDDSTIRTTAPSATTTEGPKTATGSYPPGVVEAYVNGCAEDGDRVFCECTIELFQELIPLEDFIGLIDTDLLEEPRVVAIMDSCAAPLPTTTTTQGSSAGSSTTISGTGDFTPITDIDTAVEITIADLEVFWTEELSDVYGVEYETVASYGPYFVSRGDEPRCGGPLQREQFEQNAFYCGFDDTIQWDQEGLMEPLFVEFGDFVVPLVLAHEWGHAVQARFLFDETHPTIVSELQADCFAGAWTGRVARDESDFIRLEPGDLEEAMAGFLLIGDQIGTAPGGPNAHGGSFDRLNAFFDGFRNDVEFCSTYEQTPPHVIFIPLQAGDDPIEGGDLPLAETVPTLLAALDVFWSSVYPDAFGAEWIPLASAVPYRPSDPSTLPTCGGVTAELEFYTGNVFYCAADDYIAWDDEVLIPDLYTSIGDFAVGLVIGNEWAAAVQTRAGLEAFGAAAELQADCLTGAWAADLLIEDNPMQLFLSAGDLDEGIAGFLSLSVNSTDGGADDVAFQRFEAFQLGFFNGVAACGLPPIG